MLAAIMKRKSQNVLAALHAITHEVVTVQHLTSSTAETVCALLHRLAGSHQGLPITVILDHARDQRCALVQARAQTLGIELLYWPTYSPNFNLIERFWKFVKKQCLYSTYYPNSHTFQQAICQCIDQAPTQHKDALESLLSLRFQSFQEVSVMGAQQAVSSGPKKQVLSNNTFANYEKLKEG